MREADLALPRLSHVGLCVTDMERSLLFYRNGFGFTDGTGVVVKNEHNALFGIDGPIAMQSKFLRLGGLIIELVEFKTPSPVVSPAMRPLYHTGLMHLSFRVADVRATADLLTSLGGAFHPQTLTEEERDGHSGSIAFCTDPDGTRIELIAYTPDFDFA